MELMNVRQVAGTIKLSQRTIWKLLAAGKMPRPVRIMRAVRWRAAEIDEWIRRGCPSTSEFEAATAGEGGRR